MDSIDRDNRHAIWHTDSGCQNVSRCVALLQYIKNECQ